MKHIMKHTLALLLSALLILSICACTTPTDTTSTDTPPADTTPADPPEKQKEYYEPMIAEYKALLTAKQNGEELTVPDTAQMDEGEAAIASAVFEVANTCETPEKMAYAYKDMDGNGTLELLFLTSPMDLQAIFALDGNTPVLLAYADGDMDENWYYDAEGRVYSSVQTVLDMETKQVEAIGTHFHVEGAKLVQDVQYVVGWFVVNNRPTSTEYFEVVDGQRQSIDEARYNELSADFNRVHDYSNFQTIERKLNAPRMIFPLAEQTETPPNLDFSTYEAVRETYKAISTRLEDYDTNGWLAGKYDNLFTYPDDLAYSYYQRLLYAAYNNAYYEGYDEIDLNGDGKDELVILNEDYTVKAIFTMKKGTPVMLDAYANEECWIDEEGMIHVDRTDYYEIEYSLYEFTKEGDYNLVYSILVAENGNRYLTKDGKTEIISFEDSLTLYYDEYRPFYTEPFEAKEYNRAVSCLTYTPLTPYTEDPVKAAVTKTWYKYANLDKTSGEEYGAYSNTYVTFENATDTGMDVHVKYAYTVLYPDPDREYHSLEKTTESYLDFTAREENGVFAFEADGIKGHLEFSQTDLWLVVEESSDKRFPVGYHHLSDYIPGE